jgi:hypothetical protein
MLRTILVGLLTVSAVASCAKHETETVQPGATAGNVVDVIGEVSALRGDERRPLAKGATVSGDDLIQTGADSHVTIVLAHNNARWELAANTSKKVSESVAWGLARQDKAPEVVDQATSAAGRDHEKAGAQTAATGAPAPTTVPAAAAAPEPASAVAQAPVAQPAPKTSEPARRTAASPPAPPAPPPRSALDKGDKNAPTDPSSAGEGGRVTRGADDAVGGEPGRAPTGGTAAPRLEVTAQVRERSAGGGGGTDGKAALRALLDNERKPLTACLGDVPKLTLTLHVAKGKATFEVSGGAATDKMRTCFGGVVKKLALPATDGDVSIELVR